MKNPRLCYAGLFLIVLAVIGFVIGQRSASGSNDPVQMMSVVGQVAGAMAGIGLALILMSFFVTPKPRTPRR